MKKILDFLYTKKYELLFFGLVQHLFIGAVLIDMGEYMRTIWILNMVILAITSIGVFMGKGKWKNILKNIILFIVVILPLVYTSSIGDTTQLIYVVNITYLLFFSFIFYEIILFIIKPSYINIDIILAAACGFLLLLEISVFIVQLIFYHNPQSFVNISTGNPAITFSDVVYFCSVLLTTVGFGDITPATTHARLVISVIAWIGDFYSVLLVGILVGKFSAIDDTKT